LLHTLRHNNSLVRTAFNRPSPHHLACGGAPAGSQKIIGHWLDSESGYTVFVWKQTPAFRDTHWTIRNSQTMFSQVPAAFPDGRSPSRPCLRLVLLLAFIVMKTYRFWYRGLSPHKLTPIPGVHNSIEATRNSLCAFSQALIAPAPHCCR
jgi:hypothetical protein